MISAFRRGVNMIFKQNNKDKIYLWSNVLEKVLELKLIDVIYTFNINPRLNYSEPDDIA